MAKSELARCEICGRKVPKDEYFEVEGKTLCEDCYMDHQPEDPWAGHS